MGITLSDDERDCLRQLQQGTSYSSACSETRLQHLAALGLVQRVLIQPLPILPQRYEYRLTIQGKDLLSDTKG